MAHFPIMMFAVASLDKKTAPGAGDILARIGAFSLLGSGEILACILLAVWLFPVTAQAGFPALFILVMVFTLAVAAMAIFIAMAAPNRVSASQAGMIVVLPALLLSGYTWPLSGFPWFIQALGKIEPLTYFADPLRLLMLTGKTGSLYWQGVAVLLLFSVLYSGLALWLGRKNRGVALCRTEKIPA